MLGWLYFLGITSLASWLTGSSPAQFDNKVRSNRKFWISRTLLCNKMDQGKFRSLNKLKYVNCTLVFCFYKIYLLKNAPNWVTLGDFTIACWGSKPKFLGLNILVSLSSQVGTIKGPLLRPSCRAVYRGSDWTADPCRRKF